MILNQTESHRLLSNVISLCSFSTILSGRRQAMRCTARNRDGVEQRMVFLDGDKNRDTDILESLLWYISNKVMKRLRGNVHRCSRVERLTKQCIRVKKVESDFEEREQYIVLEWYEAPVADLWSREEVSIYYSKAKKISKMKLSLFETAITRDVWLYFLLTFYCDLGYIEHNWASLRWHHTPMTTASTHSSGTMNSTTKKRTRKLSDSIKISATAPASIRGQ